MRIFKLDARLKACADLVTQGARIVDVGCDHAYLPIWLAAHNKITRAIACDANPSPLARAKANVERYGFSHIIDVRISDGLEEASPDEADEIIIAGMGGELISRILARSDWVKDKSKGLILQPATSETDLRYFLLSEGFSILKERAVISKGRVYLVILARYTGKTREVSPPDSYVYGFSGESRAELEYLKKTIRDVENRIKGALCVGNERDAGIYSEIKDRLLDSAEKLLDGDD